MAYALHFTEGASMILNFETPDIVVIVWVIAIVARKSKTTLASVAVDGSKAEAVTTQVGG